MMPKPYTDNFSKVITRLDKHFTFRYLDENDFIKKMRSLKTYCPMAYKDLIFNTNKKELRNFPDGKHFLNLYTYEEFKFVYGQIQLVFSVKNGCVIIEDIKPQQFLMDGYYNLLDIYKGVPYRNNRDKFKIDLFRRMKGDNYYGYELPII